jgi:cytochrome c-type biogenesis protein CcmH
MMTLSIVLALVGSIAGCSAAVLLVAQYGTGKHAPDVHVQRCSVGLDDIERGMRNGTLDAASATRARQVALQDLLAAERNNQSRWWILQGDRSALTIVILSAMAVIALSAFLDTDGGSTGDLNKSTPVATPPQDTEVGGLEAYAQRLAPRALASTLPQEQDKQGLPDVDTMNQRLAARLEKSPGDVEGWRMLGWSYFHMQQPEKAADAYARAVKLRPESAELSLAYGEALMATSAGAVTDKAVEALEHTLKLDASNVKARYFLALARAQAGKKQEALTEWRALQTEVKADNRGDEPWVAEMRQHMQALANELRVDISGDATAVGDGARKAGASLAGSPPRPTAEVTQSILALPIDRQQGLIRSMVDGLENRLQSAPKDEEGWLRLIRSRLVLGERESAREALTHALAAFADDEQARSRIVAGARDLGVTKE